MRTKVLAVCLAAIPAWLCAQEAPPKGEEIMDRYVAATGGRAAHEKLQSEVRKTSVEIKGRDMRLAVTTFRAMPDKAYTLGEIPGIGKVEEGVNGEVAWSLAPGRGAALKEGVERDMALYGSRLDNDLEWRKWFPKAENAGTEEIEGRICYKVLLTDPDGEQHTRFYDRQTGLLSKMILMVRLPQGKLPMELRFYDYRETGGLRQPHRTVRISPGIETESRIEHIEINTGIDPARFTVPDAVKALVEKRTSATQSRAR